MGDIHHALRDLKIEMDTIRNEIKNLQKDHVNEKKQNLALWSSQGGMSEVEMNALRNELQTEIGTVRGEFNSQLQAAQRENDQLWSQVKKATTNQTNKDVEKRLTMIEWNNDVEALWQWIEDLERQTDTSQLDKRLKALEKNKDIDEIYWRLEQFEQEDRKDEWDQRLLDLE